MKATACRKSWLAQADRITIPCPGPVESLNAAIGDDSAAL